MTLILAINCSPTPGGRTARVLEAVAEGARTRGATPCVVDLCDEHGACRVTEVLAQLGRADAFVFGSPMYRASFAAPFKQLLDKTPRGMWGEREAPLTARAVAIVATGASDHHFLGLTSMRNILVDFFAAHVVSPGLYVAGAGMDEQQRLVGSYADLARLQGQALVELAQAIATSGALAAARPLA